jgi:hypothetical protein
MLAGKVRGSRRRRPPKTTLKGQGRWAKKRF